MAHTLLHRTLNLFAFTALISGLGYVTANGMIYASLTGQGAMMTTAELHAAAAIETGYAQAYAAANLVTGILLIVLGFFIHALVRAREELTVPVTVKPKQKKTTWFWMEMRV